MALVLEADAVMDLVISTLLADNGAGGVAALTGSRIYRDIVPIGSVLTYPIVTVSLLSSLDWDYVGGEHERADVIVLTKVTDRGTNNYGPTLAIARRIAAVLSTVEFVVSVDTYVVKLRRREVVPQPSDVVNTVRYIYSNQTWFTEACPA